ncbi:uncharacterized protein LW94_160 [Fusarium fujikuroi]|nr:uncharacterized protein LW94_160 [Fusarium fujikuroi]
MAEAIGLVASVASLLDLAFKLSNALHNLQFQLRNAPYLIQALENETEAVRTVLASVESSIHSTATAGLGGAGSPGILGDLTAEIGKGAAVLKELGTFIDSLKNETSTLRRVKWIQKKKKAAELINELKEVRYRISELQLAYGNSSLTRIRLVLQDIQVMQRRHYAKAHNLETCLLGTKDQLTIDRDTALQSQSDIAAALEALQNTTPTLPPEWVEAISNQIWEVLLQAGADPDQVNEEGLSFRHRIANEQLQKNIPFKLQPEVQKLIQASQCLEDIELSFIHEVVVKRCPIDVGPILKSAKADILAQIHSEDRFGMTPLMYAVALGDAKAAQALIEAGASVHKKGPHGRNLVDYAGRLPPNTCAIILHLLLAAGADAIDAFPTGWSLLHAAAIHNNVVMIDRLLQAGAQPDCIGPRGNRPIHYAASHNSVHAIRLLYEQGADINALADHRLSSLGVAIQKNATDAQATLLELGADHRITGDWGTYLHVAAYWGNERTFNTLSCLKFSGLDVDARDAEGMTVTEVYESRYDKTEELTISFCQLRDFITSRSPDDYSSKDEIGHTDEFFDAYEFLGGDGLC